MVGYELVFITSPVLNEEDLTDVLNKIKKSLTESGGTLIHEYVWGRRRLAYEIAGNDFGVYHAWYFTGSGKTVDELNRQFGYSDDILRNQIVKTDDLDEEASFLHNLIPPKEETPEKEETQKISAEDKKEAEITTVAETKTVKDDSVTEELAETESEAKNEELADDAEKVKTEAVDA